MPSPDRHALVDVWAQLVPAFLHVLSLPCSENELALWERLIDDSSGIDVESMSEAEQASVAVPTMIALRRLLPPAVNDGCPFSAGDPSFPPGDFFPGASSLLLRVVPAVAWVALRASFGPESSANPELPPVGRSWGARADDARLAAVRALRSHGPAWAAVFERVSHLP